MKFYKCYKKLDRVCLTDTLWKRNFCITGKFNLITSFTFEKHILCWSFIYLREIIKAYVSLFSDSRRRARHCSHSSRLSTYLTTCVTKQKTLSIKILKTSSKSFILINCIVYICILVVLRKYLFCTLFGACNKVKKKILIKLFKWELIVILYIAFTISLC